MCDRHIVEKDVKIPSTSDKSLLNKGRNLRTFSKELISIELRHNRFQNFVTDRREDFLVVFETEVLNDDREFRGVGTREDSES